MAEALKAPKVDMTGIGGFVPTDAVFGDLLPQNGIYKHKITGVAVGQAATGAKNWQFILTQTITGDFGLEIDGQAVNVPSAIELGGKKFDAKTRKVIAYIPYTGVVEKEGKYKGKRNIERLWKVLARHGVDENTRKGYEGKAFDPEEVCKLLLGREGFGRYSEKQDTREEGSGRWSSQCDDYPDAATTVADNYRAGSMRSGLGEEAVAQLLGIVKTPEKEKTEAPAKDAPANGAQSDSFM
jgi:hypothetical protein